MDYSDTAKSKVMSIVTPSHDPDDMCTRSQCSSVSRLSTTSSAAMIQTRIRVETAKQSRQIDREIATRQAELESRARERRKELETLEREKRDELAIFESDKQRELDDLAAQKAIALAETEAKVVEQIIQEELNDERLLHRTVTPDVSNRTKEWVQAHDSSAVTTNILSKEVGQETPASSPDMPRLQHYDRSSQRSLTYGISNAADVVKSRRIDTKPSVRPARRLPKIPIDTCAITKRVRGGLKVESASPKEGHVNVHLAHLLAKQCLPKCEPDVYGGDVTLYHPWKSTFKAMLQNTEISAAEELTYLKRYTKEEAKDVVESFSRRLYANPDDAIADVWAALDRRFGNTAAITNAHLQLLEKSAAFDEEDYKTIQRFSDVCQDVDSQLTLLPGLACLNYPTVLQPIVSRLPKSLRQKWEKEIARYAEQHDDAYPTFHRFCAMIMSYASVLTHPNVHASRTQTAGPILENTYTTSKTSENEHNTRVLKSTSRSDVEQSKCPIHADSNHDLTTCESFARKPYPERSDIVFRAKLCFRCLVGEHRASDCRAMIQCSSCGSKRHHQLMHGDWSDRQPQVVTSSCTEVCGGDIGGLSCSKIVLVDVRTTNEPSTIQRVYAILDEQSNTSLITPELIDGLGLSGKQEKYYLTTCATDKSTRYGRRVQGVVAIALNGNTVNLPTLLECDNIPRDKTEIPTPDIVKNFPHLRDIAADIPPYDKKAEVHLLIGRDCPEILKVRSFKNGPTGAPWAHKLLLGWTVSGQVCLDRTGGPVHVKTHITGVQTSMYQYEESTCCDQIKVTETVKANDEDSAMSEEDRRLVRIIEAGFHKSAEGSCEMPLPLRDGLRRTADEDGEIFGQAVREFVKRDFYVDDEITPCDTPDSATSLVQHTTSTLKVSNPRLHKVASSDLLVMRAVPEEDRANDVQNVNSQCDPIPAIRTLGVTWNLEDDVSSLEVTIREKPYTRRRVLAVANPVCDPLGFAAPVTLQGNALLQRLTVLGPQNLEYPLGCDDSLSIDVANQCELYRSGLNDLQNTRIPRCYYPKNLELHEFSDTSKEAIGVALYLGIVNSSGRIHVTLVCGQGKVAPAQQTTTPILELCGAIMATRAVTKVLTELDQKVDDVFLLIPRSLSDITSHGGGVSAKGPRFLHEELRDPEDIPERRSVDETDPEVKTPQVKATTVTCPAVLGAERLQRFSNWVTLKRAIARLIVVAQQFRYRKSMNGPTMDVPTADRHLPRQATAAELRQAEVVLIKSSLKDDTRSAQGKSHKKPSKTKKLNVFPNINEIRRVGERIDHSTLSFDEKHLIILSKDSNITKLIPLYYHRKVHYPGRVTRRVLPDRDRKIRVSDVNFWKDGVMKALTRPISELILVLPKESCTSRGHCGITTQLHNIPLSNTLPKQDNRQPVTTKDSESDLNGLKAAFTTSESEDDPDTKSTWNKQQKQMMKHSAH